MSSSLTITPTIYIPPFHSPLFHPASLTPLQHSRLPSLLSIPIFIPCSSFVLSMTNPPILSFSFPYMSMAITSPFSPRTFLYSPATSLLCPYLSMPYTPHPIPPPPFLPPSLNLPFYFLFSATSLNPFPCLTIPVFSIPHPFLHRFPLLPFMFFALLFHSTTSPDLS